MMKKLTVFILMFSLLTVSTVSAMCVHTYMKTSGEYQITKSFSDSQENNTDKNSLTLKCEMCTCNSHCSHSNVIFVGIKPVYFVAIKEIQHGFPEGATYLSQLNYPPSKPPKA